MDRRIGEGVERTITWNERLEDRWLTDDAKATAIRLFSGLGIAVLGSCLLGIGMAVCWYSVNTSMQRVGWLEEFAMWSISHRKLHCSK